MKPHSKKSDDDLTHPNPMPQPVRSLPAVRAFLSNSWAHMSAIDPMLLVSLATCLLVLVNHAFLLSWRSHDLARCQANVTALHSQLQGLEQQHARTLTDCRKLQATLKLRDDDVWLAYGDAEDLHKDLRKATGKLSKARRQSLLVANTGSALHDGAAADALTRMDTLLAQLGESLDVAGEMLAAEDETLTVFRTLAVWTGGALDV